MFSRGHRSGGHVIHACLTVWHMSVMHKVEAKEHERAVEAMGHKLGMETMG